jgi:succinate dehydrogenase / fumarate reductase cytochrome b subunit
VSSTTVDPAERSAAGSWLAAFYRSTLGRKVVMAVTGVVLVTFVIVHVGGNLLMFSGPEPMNAYAAFLKKSAAILWSVRLVLLASLFLHVHAAWSLTRQNRAARPERYAKLERQSATFSAASLRVGGVLLLAFIVFHLLHFTTGNLHPQFDAEDPYGNVIIGFSVPAVAVFYLAAMAALALHLHHGVWSLFQTLGWNHPHVNPLRRRVATALSFLVPLAFSAIVVAVAFGVIA